MAPRYPEPQPRLPQAYWLTLVTMFGAILFGLDMGTFGIAHGLPSFLSHWCLGGGYTNGDADSCEGKHAPKNLRWMHGFVLPSLLLNVAAAALACIFIAPSLLQTYGRRLPALIGLATAAVGCFMHSFIAVSAHNIHQTGIPLWFTGRFLLGLGIGLVFATMPQWNAELVTKDIRGKTGAVIQVTNIFGVLIAGLVALAVKSNSSTSGVSEYTNLGWLIATSLTGFFAVALLIPVSMIPESPVWILECYANSQDTVTRAKCFQRALSILKTIRVWRGRREEIVAYKEALSKDVFRDAAQTSRLTDGTEPHSLAQEIWSLAFEGGKMQQSEEDDDIQILKIEAATIVCEIRCTRSPTCDVFLTNGPTRLLHRTLMAIYIGGIGQNLAGMIALNNLSFQLFSGVGIQKPFVSTAVFDLVQLLGAIFGALYLDKGGRRHNLLVGSACLCGFILVVGIGLKAKASKAMGNVELVFLLLYAFTFHATWAAAWVYPSEISYATERAKLASFGMGAHFGGATVIIGVVALMLEWSRAGTMFFFACGNFVSFVVVFFFSVETKNKKIDEIISSFQQLHSRSSSDGYNPDGYIEMGEVQ